MKKNVFSLFLAALMIVSSLVIPNHAQATYSRTMDEVRAWLDNEAAMQNVYHDGECPWFCNHYLVDFWGENGIYGVENANGWVGHCPPNWTNTGVDGNPDNFRMGDLIVEVYPPNGHVMVYYGKGSDGRHYVVDSNFQNNHHVSKHIWYEPLSQETHCYRPPISGESPITDAPAAPQNVHTDKYCYSCYENINLYWDASYGATDYWVYLWKDGVQLYATDVGNNCSHTCAPLNAGEYTFIVRAGNSYGYSNDPAAAQFIVYDSAPPAPTNVHTDKSLYSCYESINLFWDASYSATDYWVYLWKDGVQLYATDVGNNCNYTCAPLSAGEYTFIVRAGNSIEYSNGPASATFRVYDTIPSAPTNLRTVSGEIVFTSNEAIEFIWDPSLTATDYWVYMWKNGVELYGIDVGSNSSYVSEPLSEGNYTLLVRARNDFGFGSDSASLSFTVRDALLGDADSNGTVNVVDALLALRLAMGLIQQDALDAEAADVTGDGAIDVTDALLILRYSMGLIGSFPAE